MRRSQVQECAGWRTTDQAKDQKLTLDDYRRETQGAEVIQIANKVQKKGL